MNTAAAARRNGDKPFIISRTYDAPRQRVWAAWTSAEELKRWFCSPGTTMASCTLDLRVGGGCHYCLRTADGGELWGKWTCREVVAPERLVVIQSFSDAAGGITSHPMAPTWPRETLSTTTFAEHGGQTTMTIDWRVWNGGPEEHQTFDAAHDGMRMGWGHTLDQLANYLKGN